MTTEIKTRLPRQRVKKTVIFTSRPHMRLSPIEVLPEYGRKFIPIEDNPRVFSRVKILSSLLDLFVQDVPTRLRALKIAADLQEEFEFDTSDRCIPTASRPSVERYKEVVEPIVGNSPDVRFVTTALIKMYLEDEGFRMKFREFKIHQVAALTIAVIKSRRITDNKLGVKLE